MRLRLYLHKPTLVFRAQINQASFTFPIAELTYDNVTVGSYTDIRPGMTMTISAGLGDSDMGRQRVRTPATATKIFFGRSSQGRHDGELNPRDNWYVEVWDDYRVWAKIAQMPILDETVVVFKDHDIPVAGRTTNPPPVANMGPGFAGTINPSAGTALVEFDSASSWAVATGATITQRQWDIGDGLFTVGNSTSIQVRIAYPPGFRWVSLTVTDSNGNTHTTRRPVYVRSPNSDTSFELFNLDRQKFTPEGQEVTITLLSDALEYALNGVLNYPDGTLAMIWDDDVSSQTVARDGMQFIGWHNTDPSIVQAQRLGLHKTTEMSLIDVAGKLRMLPGFPQVIYTDTLRDPDTHPSITWEYMISPNIKKYAHYLLHWHSTALELADFHFKGTTAGVNYPFLVLESGGASLWEQVSSRLKQMTPDHVLTCNRRGSLAVWPDPMLLNPEDRAFVLGSEILSSQWTSVRYEHQRTPRVHWLRGGAIIAQTTPVYDGEGKLNIPTVFCASPGLAPGQGEGAQEDYERLALSQEDLNITIGHKYARLNAPESTFSFELVGSQDYNLDPADLEWVRVYFEPSLAARRGLYFGSLEGVIFVFGERGLLKSVTVRYRSTKEGLERTTEIEWEREFYGTPAHTVTT